MTNYEKETCTDCGGEFEIIPPIDAEYYIPKLNRPKDDDYEERAYECDNFAHRKIIYWIKKDISHAGGPIRGKKEMTDPFD